MSTLFTLPRAFFSTTICLAAIAAADTIRLIPATPENTRMADGSPLPEKLESIGWKWLPDQGNGGVFESIPSPNDKTTHPMLMVMASGLEPGARYECHGAFWGNTNASHAIRDRAALPAGFGLTLASINYFDTIASKEAPWLVTPDTDIGKGYGLNAASFTSTRFPDPAGLKAENDGRQLTFAQLGTARAAADGTIPVFISAFPPVPGKGRTAIDGILIRPASDDAEIARALNPETIIHLAIRAGDSVTLRRTLDAGVDLNSLDEEGLTPLFYACASGDKPLVRMLLDRGADPNTPAQSVPPLTAAAIVPSEEITSMLIKGGAIVRPSVYDSRGKLHLDIDSRFIHPLVAAIRAGSLPVAQLLAAQVPDLKIESLFPPLESGNDIKPDYVFNPREVRPMPFIIAGAVGSGHWALAEWLLEKGCKPVVPMPQAYYEWEGSNHPHVNLMVWAVVAGEEGLPFLNAMLRRGYSPVIQRDHYPHRLYNKYGIFPWDALSAACLVGNASLVGKFLPAVEVLDSVTQEHLISLAMYSGNLDVLKMVRERFPKAVPPRFEPEKKSIRDSQDLQNDETLRLLLPRTKPRPALDSVDEKVAMVMAVVASPEAAGPGDALAAYASADEAWKVVDREEVEAALAEGNRVKPWSNGAHQLSDLGDALAADVIIVASKLAGKSLSLYRFEAVEVATGLEMHREYFQEKEMNLETDLKHFLGRTKEAMTMARKHERRQAVTLVSFTANDSLPNSKTLSRMLQSAVRGKIDETPGFISLSRSQSGRLVEEQALTGTQSIWAAAHMVEAAVRPAADGRITVAMRLDTLKEGKKIQRDTEATGMPSELPALAAKAWAEAVDLQENSTRIAAVYEKERIKHAQLEAARLVREAEWMMSFGVDVSEIIPIIESASALGAPLDKIIPLHLDCLYRQTKIFDFFSYELPCRYVTRLSEISSIIQLLPLPVAYSDRIVDSLPAFTELLQQTRFYMEKTGMQGVNHDYRNFPNYGRFANQEFWYMIQFLSFVRAAVYTETLTEAQRLEFESFGRDVDSLTHNYFDLIIKSANSKARTLVKMEVLDKHMIQRNPELAKGMVLAMRSPRIYVNIEDRRPDTNLCMAYDLTSWLNPQRKIASMFIEQTPANPSEHELQLSAMARCLIADSNDRPSAFRKIMLERSKTHAAASKSNAEFYFLEMLVRNHTLGSYFDGFKRELPAHHGSKVLPHLIHCPRSAPDFLMNYNMYASMSNFDASLPAEWLKAGIIKQKYGNRLDHVAKEHLKQGKPDLLRDLHDAALTWEMVSGESVAATFAKNYGPYLGPKGGKESLEAALAADLRTVDQMSNGVFHQIQRDLRNPSDIWLNYLPYQGEVVPVDFRGDDADQLLRRKPWLIEIGCNDYKIKRKIDLSESGGMANNQNLPGWTTRYNFTPLVQSNDKFIMNASWVDPETDPEHHLSVMIDKNTGVIKTLTKAISRNNYSAISLDNEFYFLHEDKSIFHKGNPIAHPLILFHASANGEVRNLTEYGRRPELTPFDPEDLFPRELKARGDKVFVANSRDYFGEYNPVDQSWKILPSATRQQKEVYWDVMHAGRKAGKEVIQSSGGWSIDHDDLSPSMLNFDHPKLGKKQVLIDIKIPGDFVKQIKYASESSNGGYSTVKVLSHSEHVKNQPLHLILVNQTDDTLTLALQFNSKHVDPTQGNPNRFLPFLWRVSKKDVLRILE